MRVLRILAPLALVVSMVAACGNGSSSSPAASTGGSDPHAVQLRPVYARYTENAPQGDEQLGPQVPKDLIPTLANYDCSSQPTPLQGRLLECDASRTVFLMNAPLLTGGVASAVALQIGHGGQWYVRLTFDQKSASTLSQAVDSLSGQELAIVLDGHVLTALIVDSSMKDGHIGITGDYDKSSATKLARQLSA